MNLWETIRFCRRSLSGYPLRTGLMLLAMSIGVSAVVVLTSLGEGARRYVADQFTSLGTHLLIVLPGRSETIGGPPPLLGQIPRDLTVADAMALYRSSAVARVAPIMMGAAPVSREGLTREAFVLGSTAELMHVRNLTLVQGRFLPSENLLRGDAICVLGHGLKTELFGNTSPLGRFVRIGGRRFRVVGLLAKKGQSLGLDISEVVIVPVASAQALFNSYSLFRILVQARTRDAIPRAKSAILDLIRTRHDGEGDITVITQDAMLATFDRILKTLTLAVGGIAAISLVVAGILIMNVMLIAVSQRRAEIGLLKAIGAPANQIQRLFLTEAITLSVAGAALGLLFSAAGILLLEWLFPSFSVSVPYWSPLASIGVALLTGIVFGVLPARQAARMDPVAALSHR